MCPDPQSPGAWTCYADVSLVLAHTSSSLNIRFVAAVEKTREDCGDESYGFSNFKIDLTDQPLMPYISIVADESVGDASIGSGWSPSGVTLYPRYGYVHGGCGSCGTNGFGLIATNTDAVKTWVSLPTHSSAEISLRLWSQDWWDNEYAYIYVDGSLVYTSDVRGGECLASWLPYHDNPCGGGYHMCEGSCGASYAGAWTCYIDVKLLIAHSSSSFSIKINAATEKTRETCIDESFGFSNFKLRLL